MRMLYWGECMAQTDIGGLWVAAKVRPTWWWTCRRVQLFLSIVWRRMETTRLDWRTAWDVSEVAVGLVGPVPVSSEVKP